MCFLNFSRSEARSSCLALAAVSGDGVLRRVLIWALSRAFSCVWHSAGLSQSLLGQLYDKKLAVSNRHGIGSVRNLWIPPGC